jgi:2-phosphosulfolactate phosphatase
MPDPIWCDVALSHPEVPVRITDAGRARGAGPENIVCGVIDVLRATSTIVTALGNGCGGVHPCPSPDTAREKAAALRAEGGEDSVLLGGEQDARPLEGFDGGNSPLEYTRERVGGRRLVQSTSNGTKTLASAGVCGSIFIVSFANMAAAVRRLAIELRSGDNRTLLAACSGREGGYCEEDTAAAGLLIAGVRKILGSGGVELSDTASAAINVAENVNGNYARMLRECQWGKHLAGMGLGADIDFCGKMDWTDVVPQMRNGIITQD